MRCIALPLLLLCPSASAQVLEDFSWVENPGNGHWYATTFPTRAYWLDLEAQAVLMDGHLATVRSGSENDWVYQRFMLSTGAWHYLGLTDQDQEGTWVWSSGENSPYRNWGTGQPDQQGGPNQADFVAIYQAGSPEPARWNDAGVNLGPGVLEITFDPYLDSDGGGVPDAHEDQDHDGVVDTFETDPSNPADDQLAMYIYSLHPGRNLWVRVFQGAPNAYFVPALSLNGPGPTNVGAGLILDLSVPITALPAIRLDGSGGGVLPGPLVPPTVPIGTLVWFQGLEIDFQAANWFRKTRSILIPVGAN